MIKAGYKITAGITALLLTVSVLWLTACDSSESVEPKPTETTAAVTEAAEDIFDMTRYEGDEVFDIRKISLGDELGAFCVSYGFTYLSDGLKIKGYISIPLSAVRAQKPAKCVLLNRGGNGDYGKLEDKTTAFACSKLNRVVIASQYRGAGGSEGKDEFGGGDLNDVIKLIDLCDDTFEFIDMDDYCSIGISRGGMMTYMAARIDKRIKRIIAVSAVTDLAELYGERDDMKIVLYDCIGCTPEENPGEYEKRSAVCWADELTLPVMIIHSDEDKQVPCSQAVKLSDMLQERGECCFIGYSDDVHGFHEKDYKIISDWLGETPQ